MSDYLRKAVVDYRVTCDYRFQDLKNGYMSQEDYETCIDGYLDKVMRFIDQEIANQVEEAEKFNYELGYRAAISELKAQESA